MPRGFKPRRYKTKPAASLPKRAALVKSGTAPSKRKAINRAKPTPLMTSVVSKVLNHAMETKYIASDVYMNQYVYGTLDGTYPGSRLQNLFPSLVTGVGSYNRIGQKIHPIRMKVTVQYYFDHSWIYGSDLVIKQVVGTLKAYKQAGTLGNTTQKTEVLPYLIDNGDGTNSYVSPGTAQNCEQLSYPYEKERFTKLKGDKLLYISKQGGGALTPTFASGILNHRKSYIQTSFLVKCPTVIQWDNQKSMPTNFLPLFGAVGAYMTDATNNYQELLGTIPLDTGIPPNPILRMNVRTELWFKDA